MPDSGLISYVRGHIARGTPESVVRDSLKQGGGWTDADINASFTAARILPAPNMKPPVEPAPATTSTTDAALIFARPRETSTLRHRITKNGVIRFLAVLAAFAIAIPLVVYFGVKFSALARDAQRQEDIAALKSALDAYYYKNGLYPLQLSYLVVNYIEMLPTDPETGERYAYTAATDGKTARVCARLESDVQTEGAATNAAATYCADLSGEMPRTAESVAYIPYSQLSSSTPASAAQGAAPQEQGPTPAMPSAPATQQPAAAKPAVVTGWNSHTFASKLASIPSFSYSTPAPFGSPQVAYTTDSATISFTKDSATALLITLNTLPDEQAAPVSDIAYSLAIGGYKVDGIKDEPSWSAEKKARISTYQIELGNGYVLRITMDGDARYTTDYDATGNSTRGRILQSVRPML